MADPQQSVLAVQNIKGGVGKTTIAVNLAALLAEKYDKRVLLIDADPQCNASLYLLSDADFDGRTRDDATRSLGNLYDVYHEDVRYRDVVTGKLHGPRRSPQDCEHRVKACAGGGTLHLVCGSVRLFEVQEIAAEIVVGRLKRWLRAKAAAYDHVIIDCPPSVSSLSLSALKAADKILVPMMADQFSLYGSKILRDSLLKYKKLFDIKAKIAGVVMSMFPPAGDARHAAAERYQQLIRALWDQAKPKVQTLKAVISEDQAYRASFAQKLPLPFSAEPGHDMLVAELMAVAIEIGIVGGAP